MYCRHCGSFVGTDKTFCTECGAKNESIAPAPETVPAPVPVPAPVQKKKKGTSKVVLIVILIVLLLLGVAAVLWWQGIIELPWFSSPSDISDSDRERDRDRESGEEDGNSGNGANDVNNGNDVNNENVGNTGSGRNDEPTARFADDTTIHITSRRESEGSYVVDFAVTQFTNGKQYLVGKYTVNTENDDLTNEDFENAVEITQPDIILLDSYDILGENALTDGDKTTVTLILTETKDEYLLTFGASDSRLFTFNGIEITGGVHDTLDNYNTYAKPTGITGILEAGGQIQRFTLPIDVSEFQSYPTVVILPEPFEDVTEITFYISSADGSQEYIAVSEISIF